MGPVPSELEDSVQGLYDNFKPAEMDQDWFTAATAAAAAVELAEAAPPVGPDDNPAEPVPAEEDAESAATALPSDGG